jgi:hypothetical protein
VGKTLKISVRQLGSKETHTLLAEEVAEDGLYRACQNGRAQEYSAQWMDAAYAEMELILACQMKGLASFDAYD